MTGKPPHQTQRDLFQPLLIDFLDRRHELVLLADKIDWAYRFCKRIVCRTYCHKPSGKEADEVF